MNIKYKIFRLSSILCLIFYCLSASSTVLFNDGAESGTISNLTCSGNCPTVITSPVLSGTKAFSFDLTRSMPTNYRTEATFDSSGLFDLGVTKRIGWNFRFQDWAADSDLDAAGTMHTRPTNWNDVSAADCGSSQLYMAPYLVLTQKNATTGINEFKVVRYPNITVYTAPIDSTSWHSIVVELKTGWASTGVNSGVFKLWVDKSPSATPDVSFSGANIPQYACQKVAGTEHNLNLGAFAKIGVYKWNWKNNTTQSSRRQLIVDNIKIADSGSTNLEVYTAVSQSDTVAPVISAISESSVTDSAAVINWTTNEPADSTIYYGLTSQGGLTKYSSALVTSHSTVLDNLNPGTLYYYRLQSMDASGNIALGSLRSFTTAPVSSSFSSVSASQITSSSAVVSWNTPVSRKNDRVDYGLTSTYGLSIQLSNPLTLVHSAVVTGLSASTLYHYSVSGTDTSNAVAQSNDYTFVTAPSFNNVAASNILTDTALISWDTSEPGSTVVEYGPTSAYGFTKSVTENVTSHNYLLSPSVGAGLTQSTLYHYRPCGLFDGAYLCGSDQTFTTAVGSLAVTNIVLTKTKNSATIAWSTNQLSDSTVYYGSNNRLLETPVTNAAMQTSHGINITGLQPNTTYYYRIKSTNATGVSAYSDRLVFRTNTKSGLKSDSFN